MRSGAKRSRRKNRRRHIARERAIPKRTHQDRCFGAASLCAVLKIKTPAVDRAGEVRRGKAVTSGRFQTCRNDYDSDVSNWPHATLLNPGPLGLIACFLNRSGSFALSTLQIAYIRLTPLLLPATNCLRQNRDALSVRTFLIRISKPDKGTVLSGSGWLSATV